MPSDDFSMLLGDPTSHAATSGLYAPVTQDEIDAAAKAAGIDPGFYGRILKQEAGVRESPKGARGPAQLMPDTAARLGVDPNDREQNLLGGAKYLRQQLDTFGGDQKLAAAAYNAGPGAVQHHGGVPPYAETQGYVAGVMGDAPSDPDLDALLGGHEDAPAPAKGDPAEDAYNQLLTTKPSAVPASPADAPPQGSAVYDPGAGVMRDQTGRVVAIGNADRDGARQVVPKGATVVDPRTGETYTRDPANPAQYVNAAGKPFEIAQPANTNAADIQAWVAAHPNDPGAKPFNPAILPGQSGFDRAGAGFQQGLANVGNTIDNAQLWADRNIPGMGFVNDLVRPGDAPSDAQLVSGDIVNRLRNDYQYRNSGAYGVGKFGGELIPTVAGIMATEGLGSAALAGAPRLAGAADFLAGSGGQGNLLTRAASLGLGGARQGATAAAITSGGSDAPLGNQLAGGALTGAAMGVAAPALAVPARAVTNAVGNAGRMVSNAFLPLTASGRGQIADNMIRRFAADGPTTGNADTLVEGSSPTLAQSLANPGLAAVERAVRDIRPNQFNSLDRANAAARIQALTGIAGTPETIEELEAARDQKALPLLNRALSNASPADASAVVSKIDEILASPAGQRDAVRSNLLPIRAKLTSQPYEEGGPPAIAPRGPAPLPTPGAADVERALADVRDTRTQPTGGMVRAMQELGGVKVRALDGSLIAGPDVLGALNGFRAPGLINNKSGMSPEYMAQALHDRGFFGPQVEDPSAAFADALAEHARGAPVYKPGTVEAGAAARAQGLDQEMQEAGVLASDRPNVAAQKLAAHRFGDTQEAAAIHAEANANDPDALEFDRLSAPRPALLADRTQDPSQLYGIRQSITDALSPLAARAGSNAQLAARELMGVKGTLDDAIEHAAPGYKDYLSTYSQMSHPANAQSYLQGLNLTDAQGNITLAKVKSAIEGIAKRQQLPGVNDAKSVTPEQIGALRALYADLQRASNSSLGKSIGSNTFQNLATNNLMANVGAPAAAGLAAMAHHPLLAPLALAGRWAYSAQNEPIIDALTERLLDPRLGGNALNGASLTPKTSSPLVRNLLQGVNDNLVSAATIYNQMQQRR